LRRAQDAIEVDTTALSLDEVVAAVESIVRRRLGL
jgi:cytidylate kinase